MKLYPIDFEYDEVMTVKDFYDSVKAGHFIDYDGSGYFSDGLIYDRDAPAIPSVIFGRGIDSISYKDDMSVPTHVVWFNK